MTEQKDIMTPCEEWTNAMGVVSDRNPSTPSSSDSSFYLLKSILEDSSRTRRWCDWLAGKQQLCRCQCQRQQHGDIPCRKRIDASFYILNAIRDSTRPFLEISKPTTTTTTQTSLPIIGNTAERYDQDFPSLNAAVSSKINKDSNNTAKEASKKKGKPNNNAHRIHNNAPSSSQGKNNKQYKRRIRPILTEPVQDGNTLGSCKTGNLVNLPVSTDDHPSDSVSFPRMTTRTYNMVVARPNGGDQPQQTNHPNEFAVTPEKEKQSRMGSTTTKTATTPTQTKTPPSRKHNLETAANFTTPHKHPESQFTARLANDEVDDNDDDKQRTTETSTKTTSESMEEIIQLPTLQNLVALYCSLIDYCLVPSSSQEIQLLLRLLSWTDDDDDDGCCEKNYTVRGESTPLSFLLTTPNRCIGLASCSLQKQTRLLRGLGPPFLQNLVQNPSFCKHLPDLTEEFKVFIQEQAATTVASVSFSLDQTALLTLPFKQERDSRHNYRTKKEQAEYTNREESRDAFLYQLRAFLHARQTLIDATKASRAMQQIRISSRALVDNLMDSNRSWFAEFFCDLLLQIGHVPIQETDRDILKIIDKETLEKLHRRFSAKPSNSDRSTKHIASGSKLESNGTSPIVAAQQYFPGHQEFFFHFLVAADSYILGIHLRALLITKIQDLMSNITLQDAERKITDLRLLSKFLGLLAFSPNWLTVDEVKRSTSANNPSLDGLIQLSAGGLSIVDEVVRAFKSQRLVIVIPWVVELLKMAKWDRGILRSKPCRHVLALLRQIQLKCNKDVSSFSSASQVLISQTLEILFSDVVGLATTASLVPRSLPSVDPTYSVLGAMDFTFRFYNTNTLLVANTNVEELHILSEKMKCGGSMSMRSPGASRKLRPSAVESTPTISPDHPRWSDVNLEAPNISVKSLTEAITFSFQTKLRDSFFHQQSNLKQLCELAASQALTNLSSQLVTKCIKPLMCEPISDEDQLESIQARALQTCQGFMHQNLEHQMESTLLVLCSPEIDEATRKVAVSLTLAFSRNKIEALVRSIVGGEIEKERARLSRSEKRQLFLGVDDIQRVRDNASNLGTDHLSNVTSMITRIIGEIDSFPNQSNELISRLQSLRSELQTCISIRSDDIPRQDLIRPFYEAVLLLDERVDEIFQWALNEQSSSVDERWTLLSSLLLVAVDLSRLSHHGLRSLVHCIQKEGFLDVLLDLGLRSKETTEFSTLLNGLSEAKMLRPALVRNGLISRQSSQNEVMSLPVLKLLR